MAELTNTVVLEQENSLQDIAEELNKLVEPSELIAAVLTKFGKRAAIQTSLQINTAVAIDMAANHFRHTPGKFRVYTLDTGMLFPETIGYIEEMNRRYGGVLAGGGIEVLTPEQNEIAQLVSSTRFGRQAYFESVDSRKKCCRIRKVEPNRRVLGNLDAYIVGLRRDESSERGDTLRVSLHEYGCLEKGKRTVIKAAPFVEWTLRQMVEYVKSHDVPINPLYGMGYPSFGCGPDCSVTLKDDALSGGVQRVLQNPDLPNRQRGLALLERMAELSPAELSRVRDLTRWPWEASGCRECGLHYTGGAGI